MALLKELGVAARQRRQELGLSQGELAQLAELSRATITNLENGTLQDLSSTRVERLANSLGFAVGLMSTGRPKHGEAMQAAARLASVPYKKELPADVLEDALTQGSVPPGFIPQLRTLLQEAPVAVLSAVADEMERERGEPRKATWARMRALAAVLKCDRPLWSVKST